MSNQTSVSKPFSYDAPVISGFGTGSKPTEGQVPLVINGNIFGPVGQQPIVGLLLAAGWTVCPYLSHSHTLIQCTLPQGNGTAVVVSVEVDSQLTQSTATFSYDGPSISSSTTSGPTAGGVAVIISGASFDTAGSVTIGGRPCLVPGSVGGTYGQGQIICELPAGQGQGLPVVVTTIDNHQVSTTFFYNLHGPHRAGHGDGHHGIQLWPP